jgi:hypothetical protein
VIVVSGNFNDDRLSQGWLPFAAFAAVTPKKAESARAQNAPKILVFIQIAP